MPIPKVKVRETPRKNGSTYSTDYWLDGKRYRKVQSTNKRQAEAIASKIQYDLTMGKHDLLPEKQTRKSIDEIIDEYLLSKRHEVGLGTVRRYRNHLEPLRQLLNKQFPQVANDISLFKSLYFAELIDYVKENYSWAPVTINRMREMVSSLFTFAIDRDYLNKNPIKGTKSIPVPEKDVPEYFTKSELEKIWAHVDPFWKPFLRFVYHTGLRKGELINLTWQKVDLGADVPTIKIISVDEWTTKTKRSRTIPLNKNALSIIKHQIDRDPKFVFVSKKGEKIHPNTPYVAIKKALKDLNLKGDVHKLRHTHASQLVMEGKNIFEVQKLLGHSKIETTQIYAHLSPEHQKSVVEALEEDYDD